MPDRIEFLLQDLADEAARVSPGSERCVDGMRYTPVRSLYEEALRLIRAWQGRHPAQPTLEDLMLAFAADFPNSYPQLMFYDPKRERGVWMATAHGYNWRAASKSPAEAIAALRAQIDAVTISELPTLPEGHEWVGLGASGQWQPEAPERIAWQRERNDGLLFGSPPPLSVVWLVPDYRLYVPVKA